MKGNKNVPAKQQPTKVIIDTNFFFIPLQFGVDIYEALADLLNMRFEPVLLSSTQTELQGLSESRSIKTRKQALAGLVVSEKCVFVNVEKSATETFDDVIVRVAVEWHCPVATNDKELHQRLRAVHVPVSFLRQKRLLAVDGAV
jgi:rRNA-processing protein FCF1